MRITQTVSPLVLLSAALVVAGCASQPRKWGGTPAPTKEKASVETTNASVENKEESASAPNADGPCEHAACIPLCNKTKSPEACKEAGYALRDGSGVEPNFAKAATAFDRACKKQERYSCHELAKAYLVGEGVTADVPKGIALHTTACDLGVGQACDDLAKLHEKGEVIPQDHTKAIELLARGCVAEDYQVWTCTSLRRALDKKDKLAIRVLADWKKACGTKQKDSTACRGVERLSPKDAAKDGKKDAAAKGAPKK